LKGRMTEIEHPDPKKEAVDELGSLGRRRRAIYINRLAILKIKAYSRKKGGG